MTHTDLSPFVEWKNPFTTRSAPACGTGFVSHYNHDVRQDFMAEDFATIDNPGCCPAGSTKFGVAMPIATIALWD